MGKLTSSPALGSSVSKKAVQKALKGPATLIPDTSSGSADAATINAMLAALRQLGLFSDTPVDTIVAGPDTGGTVTSPGLGIFNYTKSAPSNWDGGVHGSPRAGDFRYKLVANNLQFVMFGATTSDPAASSSYGDITHIVRLTDTGSIGTYDGSTYGGAEIGTYVAGDTFWVDRAGDTVTMRQGADFATATVLRTDTMSGPVALDLSVFTSGASLTITPLI